MLRNRKFSELIMVGLLVVGLALMVWNVAFTPRHAKAQGIGYNALVSGGTYGSGAGSGAAASLNETNQSAGYHTLYWTVSGSVSTCTVQLETASTVGASYTLMTSTTAQTCTSSGAYVVQAQVNNFTRFNVTAFTSTSGSVTFTLVDVPGTPVGIPSAIGGPNVPAANGGLPVFTAGSGGTQITATTLHMVAGQCTEASGTCTITYPTSQGFTAGSTSFPACVDQTTASNSGFKAVPGSSSLVITGSGTGSGQVDVVSCIITGS